jgi:hypothetical protein
MFGSTTIEVFIGMIVVFIFVSTICTAIREGIESKLKTRAAYLEQGIRQLLNDSNGTQLAKDFYEHPLIASLFDGDYTSRAYNGNAGLLATGRNMPSYIPSKNFARALMDMAATGKSQGTFNAESDAPVVSLAAIRQNISDLGDSKVQRALLNAVDMAQGDLNKAQENIENWFNSTMDRVSGWYKRSTQWIIFVIALFVAISMNIDTITIVNYLMESDTARKVMIGHAEAIQGGATVDYDVAKAALENYNLPIGWKNLSFDFKGGWYLFLTMLMGWMITALAATLGAPYWFDMLNKVMVIRSTVKPHEKSPEEDSQDARASKSPAVIGAANTAVASNTGATYHPAHEDCCALNFGSETADEELPESKGG